MTTVSLLNNGKPIRVLYFGHFDIPGHYLWEMQEGRLVNISLRSQPFLFTIDGGLIGDETPDLNYRTHQFEGWTLLTFWDRTGDKRLGANSGFLADAEITDELLIALAKKIWPTIFRRFGQDLRKAKEVITS